MVKDKKNLSKYFFFNTKYLSHLYLSHLNVQFIDYFFVCARLYKSLLPHKNVKTPITIRYFIVWNILSWSQKRPNRPKMAPRPKWNPKALNVKGKFDTLILSFIQRIKRSNKGKRTRTLNKFETNLAGLLSGSRKRCCNRKKMFVTLIIFYQRVITLISERHF